MYISIIDKQTFLIKSVANVDSLDALVADDSVDAVEISEKDYANYLSGAIQQTISL